MQAILDFPDRTIKFELFDTPYKNHLIQHKFQNHKWRCHPLQQPFVFKNDEIVLERYWQNCISAYKELCKIAGTKEKLFLPGHPPKDNFILNKLHRLFTLADHDKIWDGVKLNDTAEVAKLVNMINDNVHNIEPYIDNDTKKAHEHEPIQYLDILLEPNTKDRLFKLEDYDDYTSCAANVFAVKHITGKDFLTAYFDEDNPLEWDVKNYHITYVGFTIDINGDFVRMWNNERFKSWLSNNNFKGKIGFWPIGTILEPDLEWLRQRLMLLRWCKVHYK